MSGQADANTVLNGMGDGDYPLLSGVLYIAALIKYIGRKGFRNIILITAKLSVI